MMASPSRFSVLTLKSAFDDSPRDGKRTWAVAGASAVNNTLAATACAHRRHFKGECRAKVKLSRSRKSGSGAGTAISSGASQS
jgi:hypothetical protein